MTQSALWYLGRGSGIVSLALLTLVMALGVVTRAGRPLPGLPRFAVAALHRTASLLAVVFLAVHIVTLSLDKDSKVRWFSSVVPFTSHFRPLWIGLGALGCDLIVALVATSLLRARIGPRVWRAIHWTAYLMWPLAMAHTIGSGTDVTNPLMIGFLVGCGGVVAAMVAWRVSTDFLDNPTRRPRRRVATPVASATSAALIPSRSR
jgi:sulfoxide reductase heme-binding subunit YedZ